MRHGSGPSARRQQARRTLWQACIALQHAVHRGRVTSGSCAPALVLALAAVSALLLPGCGGGADDVYVPTVYIVAGRVVDPTTSPIEGIVGADVRVDTAPDVRAVTSDSEGNFILEGVPAGTHRLRAEFPGRVVTLSYDLRITRNEVGALLPLFTPQQVDSILTARGAPAWDRQLGLFGLFALKSTGVPLGDALVTFQPSPGGEVLQTGEGKDPIVVVNAQPGPVQMSVARGGYVWDGPYGVTLAPGILTFAAPRARPNFAGFVFANNGSGAPVSGAAVQALDGPTTGVTATTNFLGQFSLVGLLAGSYVARVEAPGFLRGRTFPQPIDQDTTLAHVLVRGDTLAAWAAGAGVAAPDPALGHVAVETRALEGGAWMTGAAIVVEGGAQGGSGVPGRAAPQAAGAPALTFDLPAGLYRVRVNAPGATEERMVDSVRVEAGAVTWTRVELTTTAPARARTRIRR